VTLGGYQKGEEEGRCGGPSAEMDLRRTPAGKRGANQPSRARGRTPLTRNKVDYTPLQHGSTHIDLPVLTAIRPCIPSPSLDLPQLPPPPRHCECRAQGTAALCCWSSSCSAHRLHAMNVQRVFGRALGAASAYPATPLASTPHKSGHVEACRQRGRHPPHSRQSPAFEPP